MTVDLAEEHSTSQLASERLELETAERLRLENEVHHLQVCVQCLRVFSELCYPGKRKKPEKKRQNIFADFCPLAWTRLLP